jgi:Flp pilus assembly protein TadD
MPPTVVPVPAPPSTPRIPLALGIEATEPDVLAPTSSAPPSQSSLKAAIARAPLKAAPYLVLALLEIERNEYMAAERTLAKVLYLAPDLVDAHYRLGLLQARRGSFGAARRSFFNALRAATARGDEAPDWARIIGVELARMDRK